jgi:hypothetical protein
LRDLLSKKETLLECFRLPSGAIEEEKISFFDGKIKDF